MAERIMITENLTKQYKNSCAVDHVSMSIERGDIYGFIGANGAGKTTFMRMICGLVKPSQGSLSLYSAKGETALQGARKKLGALIEHPALYPNMSAMENLEIQRRYLAADLGQNPKKALEELLELVDLKDTGRKKAGTFSMGMKQRLGLALALIGSPEFIILDEPSVGLDPIGVVELRKLLLKLNRERGMTILFSSHNLSEMSQLATRYGFLHKGRLVKELTAPQLELECASRNKNLESYFVELVAGFHNAEAKMA